MFNAPSQINSRRNTSEIFVEETMNEYAVDKVNPIILGKKIGQFIV